MKNRREQGSITMLVIVFSLLMIMILMFFWVAIKNQKQQQSSDINRITQSYNGSDQEMERVYSKQIENN